MEKQLDIKITLLNNRKSKDITDEFHVHSSTVKRYVRKIFPQKPHLQDDRHAIVPNAMKHYIEFGIITGYLIIAKEVFMELGNFDYLLAYCSGVNVLRSINLYLKLKKSRHF